MPFVTEELVELGYMRTMEATHDPNAITALALERHGGECPRCKRPFIRMQIDNAFGKVTWFQPNCRCFKRCERVRYPYNHYAAGCGRFLVAEGLMGIDFCTTCGDHRDKPKARRASSGDIVKSSGEGE
jgi:hypothetical protein